MNKTAIKTRQGARQKAIDWQLWQSNKALSYYKAWAAYDKARVAYYKAWAAYDKAWAAYDKAFTDCNKAWVAYDKAWAAYDKARVAYYKAWAAYDKARAAYDKTKLKAQFLKVVKNKKNLNKNWRIYESDRIRRKKSKPLSQVRKNCRP